jgi:hypothetical protein
MNEQNSSMMAYCGLNCADCFSYKINISEAAKSLRREMHSVKLKEVWKDIPFLGEYEQFKKSLDGLAKMRCTKSCSGGGGNPWCKIRNCCQKKEIKGCWECDSFETCNKLLERYRVNIKQIKKTGIDGFLAKQAKGKTVEVK